MRKHELYPDYRDMFENYWSKEIERVWIKEGEPIRRDWFVFGSVDEAMMFFNKRCGVFEGWYA